MQADAQAVLRALGPAIRARRKAAGYTQAGAAGRVPGALGSSLARPGAIWATIETSQQAPALLSLLLMADALGTSASQLLADAEQMARGDAS